MEIFKLIESKISYFKGLKALLVYGSYANGQYRQDSDIDIAYLTDYKEPISKLDLLAELSEISTLPDIDLVCLNDLSPISNKRLH